MTRTNVKSWKVAVKTLTNDNWVYNSLRFFTAEQAQFYADQLFVRWTQVTKTEVQASDDEPNQERRRTARVNLDI